MASKSDKEAAKASPHTPQALFKALSHELRTDILTFLDERGMASPNEMAQEGVGPLDACDYHCKQLVKYGCIEEAETKKRRGATEHFYRPTTRPLLDMEQWAQMSPVARKAFSAQIARLILDDLEAAFTAGTVDRRTDRHMARMPMWVDEEGWLELREIYKRTLGEVEQVERRSSERCGESGEKPFRVSTSQLFFELPS